MRIAYEDRNFGAERLARIETANAIIREYRADGLTLTLRQLYYQFVARGLLDNNDRSYKNLGALISEARMAGLVSWSAIEDRGRSVHAWLCEEDERNVVDGLEYGLALDFWKRQGVYVVVAVEKDALSSVVARPAERFRAPYLACKGYLSQSAAWRLGRDFLERAEEGRRCVLIHLGDHDPSGIDMTRDNAERLDQFANYAGVEVRRIALNMDQVDRYNPPENPAKLTDSRVGSYLQTYGDKSWELDALEPRVLDRLITSELESLIDPDVWRETQEEEDERRQILAAVHERWEDVRAMLSSEPDL